MRILFITDIHIKFKNLAQITVLQAGVAALTEKPDLVVLGGDILDNHEKVDTWLLNRAYAFIDACRNLAPVYCLVGNHDYVNNSQFLTTNHWMNGLKEWGDVIITDRPIIDTRFNLVFVPYVTPGRFGEALACVEGWQSARCIFAHQEFRGCKMGHIVSSVGDFWDPDWPPVISGHIHEPQILENVYYPGSSLPQAFTVLFRGPCMVELTEKVPSFNYISLNLAQKSNKKITVSEAEKLVVSGQVNTDCRFVIEGTVGELAALRRTAQFKKWCLTQPLKFVPRLDYAVQLETWNECIHRLIREHNEFGLLDDFKRISVL